MKPETKKLLESIITNALGTVIGTFVIIFFGYVLGEIKLLVIYWKEIIISIVFVFTISTLVVWFRKLLKIERDLENIRNVLQIEWHTNAIRKIREDLILVMNVISNGKVSLLKRKIIELEIENFRNGNQVGELSQLIEKLDLDLKENVYYVEDDLMEIREYIKKKGMPHFYIKKLNQTLKLVNEDYSILKKEILTLSQDKLHKI